MESRRLHVRARYASLAAGLFSGGGRGSGGRPALSCRCCDGSQSCGGGCFSGGGRSKRGLICSAPSGCRRLHPPLVLESSSVSS